MMPQRSIAKELSSRPGDRLIRALVANQKNNGFHSLTFSENEIQGIAEMGQNRSALVLRSGVEIPVALSYEQLEQKIYQPDFRNDGPVLDLRAVTGIAEPQVGDKMPDGTVFAGISPDTNKPMYVTPADAPLNYTFNEAQAYAKKLNAHGHQDWRVPTPGELNVLFNNLAAVGGFNVTGSFPHSWYWSASQFIKWSAWVQRFSDGHQLINRKDYPASVRVVRG